MHIGRRYCKLKEPYPGRIPLRKLKATPKNRDMLRVLWQDGTHSYYRGKPYTNLQILVQLMKGYGSSRVCLISL